MKIASNTNQIQYPVETSKKFRWTIVCWLLIGGIINYLDRTNLSIATPEIMKDLGFSKTDIGLLGAIFSWVYASMQLPAGWLIDKYGAKRVYFVSIILWSVATALTGMANTLVMFIIARIFLGIGEAPTWPTGAKITSEWFPKKERGLATGFWDSASKWGPAISPPILIFLMVTFGWRGLFFATGLIGIIFGVIFLIFYRSPEKSRKLTEEEWNYISSDHEEDNEKEKEKIKWGTLFTYRTVWGLILGYFCTIWIWNIFLVFLPLYLIETYHISLTELGVYASIPYLGGVFGNIFGGYLTKKMVDRGMASPMNSKRILISTSAILTAVVVVILPFVHSIIFTVALMTLAICFISSITGGSWALAADVSPTSVVASTSAIMSFGGYFGGAFSPIVAGMIVDTTGSYTLAFISGGIIAGCAALCFWGIVKKPIEVRTNYR
ncbi:MFS transporter [Peribacillus simplex]|uniref:MFS transporter n=1 Tax=Peribacillus simplex TaxID=1478 RepID=UPI002040951D|nr:MFS transporter [Peribacillus simplex]MCM3676092.1 MFS transporter [Peribacillus simplex]